MHFSITRGGNPLDPSLYKWDEKTRTLSTREPGLVLDFTHLDYCTFKTGDTCTFITRDHCTFDTGNNCTFNIWNNCTLKTGDFCIFDTGINCTFDTGDYCTFNIRYKYKEIKHGKGCVAIIRVNEKTKIINFDEPSSIRFLKEA